jgi:phenylalanyl-tRNA synthetase beta subunit
MEYLPTIVLISNPHPSFCSLSAYGLFDSSQRNNLIQNQLINFTVGDHLTNSRTSRTISLHTDF